MVVKRTGYKHTISLLTCSSLLSMNSEVAGDMCVADPCVEQSSCSMEQSCTGESTRSENGNCGDWEAARAEISTVAATGTSGESTDKTMVTEKFSTTDGSDKSVMIIDLSQETEGAKKAKIKPKSKTQEVKSDEVQTLEIKNVSGGNDKISEDIISEIDREIYKSLQKQLGLKSIFGFKPGDMKGSKRPRTPVLEKETASSGAKQKPKPPPLNAVKTIELIDKGKYGVGNSIQNQNQNRKEHPNIPQNTIEIKLEQPKEDANKDEDVVWICFVCAKEFANQEELMSHQNVCDDSFTEDNTDPPIKEKDVSVAVKSGTEKISLPSSVSGSLKASPTPVPTKLTKVGTGIKSLPLGLPSRRFIYRRKPIKEIYIPPPRETYFECLGLGQTPAVEEIFRSPRKSVSEEDCQIIDLTLEDKTQHSSPITPRTRSLMSQLSRDESTRRRHLSFSSSTPTKSEIKTVENRIDEKKSSTSSDSESSESSEDDTIKRKNIPPRSALLTIPLTSPLGQRLKKHWQNDNKVPVISNIESFCKTVEQMTIMEQHAVDKKNPMMEKLRHRPPPQITFRFTKKYLNKWFHLYKFNKADKLEFEKVLRTGLERESRRRAKHMKPCKVVLQRLNKKDIKYWTTPRVRPSQRRYVQCFKQLTPNSNFANIRANYMNTQSIIRPYQSNQRMVYVNQMNRGRYQAPILHQQRASYSGFRLRGSPVMQPMMSRTHMSHPTPQLLVRPHSGMGNNGMRLEVMQINSNFPRMQGLLNKPYSEATQSNQRRKQTFANVRTDDNMVICLSSDEEEDQAKQKQSCVKCSQGVCTQHNNNHKQGGIMLAESAKLKYVRNSTGSFIPLGSKRPGGSVNKMPTVSQLLNTSKPARFVNSQAINTKQETPVSSTPPGYVSLLSTNSHSSVAAGKSDEGRENHLTISMETETAKEPAGEGSGRGRSQSQSDSEYMDYEVICIDSENEEDDD